MSDRKASQGIQMERIAILAGGGSLPLVLADSIAARGGTAHIVAVRGEAGPEVEAYPHTWVTWGAVNKILTTLRRESDNTMMIAGSVNRPDLMRLEPDLGVIRHFPKILAMLRGGDDAVLTRLIRFFETQGFTVKGVADIAPNLLATQGTLGAPARASSSTEADTAQGFAILDALADLDVGQAVAIEHGSVLAIEGVEGTDRMLSRVANLPSRVAKSGVLVKGPKHGQDLRVDIPTVGTNTIRRLEEAQLKTLVIAAGKTLLLGRDEMISKTVAAKITIHVLDRESDKGSKSIALPPRWSPPVAAHAGTVWGRLVPNFNNSRDARTAIEVAIRLAPFGTGRAAVVVRDHVLAIAAAEGVIPMAQRLAALRQWGRGRIVRFAGAAALRCADVRDEPIDLTSLIESLAAAGIAGLAVFGETRTAIITPSAIASADRLGLFLIEVEVPATANPSHQQVSSTPAALAHG
jgi:UDP-2,3-diacylglucosamine hydrolase